jgi:hypothetical protein
MAMQIKMQIDWNPDSDMKYRKTVWHIADKIIGLNFSSSNSTKHSPSWGTDGRSAAQYIPRLLLNLDVHTKIQPLVPVLSQMRPVHTLTPYLIHFNIILPFGFTD